MNEHHQQLLKITFTGLTAALAYVAFTFLQIKIPVGAGDQTSIHHRTVFNSRRAGDLPVRVFSDGLLLSGAPFSDGLCISSCTVI